MASTFTINTDGSCIGNPGPGGFAAIIEYDSKELTVSGGDPNTTNNQMELTAVIEALKATVCISSGVANCPITVRSDSQYVINAFKQHWLKGWKANGWRNSKGPLPNKELWQELDRLTSGLRIEWVWVKGHSGDPKNEECDRLALDQAGFAASSTGPWVSIGDPNPRSNDCHDGTVTSLSTRNSASRLDKLSGHQARELLKELTAAIEQSNSLQDIKLRAKNIAAKASL